MEEHRKIIEGLVRSQGYTEEEAEVAYHLVQAENLLMDVYKRTFESGSGAVASTRGPNTRGIEFRMSQVEPHFRALFALLDRRVLKRHYPQKWWRAGDPEGETRPD